MSEPVVIDILLILGFLAVLAVSIWAGVRRYRELGTIARDILTAPNAPNPEMLRSKLARSPTVVRPFFRILGFVAGPLMVVGGLGFLGMSLWALVGHGLHSWWTENREFTVTGVGCLAIGALIMRAAITGRDPYLG